MTDRIAVAPWHRSGGSVEAECELRAEQLGVVVATEHKAGRYPGWLVRVHRGAQSVDLRSSGDGSPWPVIAAALDDWTARYDWTPEELHRIHRQTRGAA